MKITLTLILAKSKREKTYTDCFWNGKAYNSKHEGGVRIYLDEAEVHCTKESLELAISKKDDEKKEYQSKKFDSLISDVAFMIGNCDEKEAHRKLALLLNKINTKNIVNEKTSSNCDFTQMLNKMSEQATLTYNK